MTQHIDGHTNTPDDGYRPLATPQAPLGLDKKLDFAVQANGLIGHDAAHPAIPAKPVKPTNSATAQQSGQDTENQADGAKAGSTPSNWTIEQLAEHRGLPLTLLKQSGFGTFACRDHRRGVRIPYLDAGGNKAGARSMFGPGWYEWAQGRKPSLYGLQVLADAKKTGVVLLTASELDMVAASAKNELAVAVPDREVWNEAWAKELDGIASIIIAAENKELIDQIATSSLAQRVSIREGDQLRPLNDAPKPADAPQAALEPAAAEPAAEAEPDTEKVEITQPVISQADVVAGAKARASRDKTRAAKTKAAGSTGRKGSAPNSCAALASCPDILTKVIERLRDLGVVAADEQVKLIYLVAVSRYLPKPAAVIFKGPSGTGKSVPLQETLRLVTPGSVETYSKASRRSLFYGDSLAHRLLYVPEESSLDDEQEGILRLLISESKVLHQVSVKIDGEWVKQTLEINGPIAYVSTTTAASVHAENETRLLSFPVPDSAERRRIMLRHKAQREAEGTREVDLSDFHALDNLLASSPTNIVTLPFLPALAELVDTSITRSSRDYDNVCALIKAHAFLHQKNRKRNAQGHVVATIADYSAVHALAASILANNAGARVSPPVRRMVEELATMKSEGVEQVWVTNLAMRLGVDKAVVSRSLKDAVASGYVKNLGSGHGTKADLHLDDTLPEDREVLPSPERLLEEWDKSR